MTTELHDAETTRAKTFERMCCQNYLTSWQPVSRVVKGVDEFVGTGNWYILTFVSIVTFAFGLDSERTRSLPRTKFEF